MSDTTGPTIMYLLPDATQCEIAADQAKSQSGFSTEFYRTLWLLLSAGFGILLTCSPAFGQFTVTERSQFVVTERTAESTDELYVVMISSPSCGPCQAYKRAGHWDRVKARYPRSGVVDIATLPHWPNRRVPQFILARVSDRRIVRQWTGATTIETIETRQQSGNP